MWLAGQSGQKYNLCQLALMKWLLEKRWDSLASSLFKLEKEVLASWWKIKFRSTDVSTGSESFLWPWFSGQKDLLASRSIRSKIESHVNSESFLQSYFSAQEFYISNLSKIWLMGFQVVRPVSLTKEIFSIQPQKIILRKISGTVLKS